MTNDMARFDSRDRTLPRNAMTYHVLTPIYLLVIWKPHDVQNNTETSTGQTIYFVNSRLFWADPGTIVHFRIVV